MSVVPPRVSKPVRVTRSTTVIARAGFGAPSPVIRAIREMRVPTAKAKAVAADGATHWSKAFQ
jgi:hypothetical protein